ncbi:MAG: 3-oxoacyl-ACP reductase FabG [Alphaproteobacteria bacterium]|nr:3-oxoacyl-ACP reductase FabG [Alphaproteobacteria bacterium]
MTKVAFITGASRGIGAGIAKRLVAEGFKVAVGYQSNKDSADAIAQEADQGISVQLDVGSRSSIKGAISCIERDLGPVDILVNNAGIAQEKPFFDITDDDWDNMLVVNLRSNFMLAQETLPHMLDQGWGRIVNISSIGGQWGGLNQVHYAAAKAAQLNFTRSLAKLFSEKGVTANAIAIGLAQTDMSAAELSRDDGIKKVAGIPVGRLANVSEIAAAVNFLISDEAGYITGQTINLNGGMYFD